VQRNSNSYTFTFALIVCVVCSLLLSLVSEGLKSKKDLNVVLDIQKNILKAVNLREPLNAKASAQVVKKTYSEKIKEMVIDGNGEVVEGKLPADLKEDDKLYPLYVYRENDQVLAYCFPVNGKGLWSTLYGYFALEPDAKTVRGITFYKHGETPGLGAEIEKDWFLNNFKGKNIWDEETRKLVPTAVVKGKVSDVVSKDKQQYYVDGISGATMTSKGVTALIDQWLNVYEAFFKKIRK